MLKWDEVLLNFDFSIVCSQNFSMNKGQFLIRFLLVVLEMKRGVKSQDIVYKNWGLLLEHTPIPIGCKSLTFNLYTVFISID